MSSLSSRFSFHAPRMLWRGGGSGAASCGLAAGIVPGGGALTGPTGVEWLAGYAGALEAGYAGALEEPQAELEPLTGPTGTLELPHACELAGYEGALETLTGPTGLDGLELAGYAGAALEPHAAALDCAGATEAGAAGEEPQACPDCADAVTARVATSPTKLV